jgi:hypothetical protein
MICLTCIIKIDLGVALHGWENWGHGYCGFDDL